MTATTPQTATSGPQTAAEPSPLVRGPRRLFPTVPVHPRLLVRGDLIHPDDALALELGPGPFRVSEPARPVTASDGTRGWQLALEDGLLVYLVRDGVKVRTRRRGSQHTYSTEQADEQADNYAGSR